jgi:FkbM family methyltransferase
MYVDTADQVIAPVLLRGLGYEVYELELFKQRIKPNMVVVDVGANNGYYALVASRLVGPHGRVYAFEPEARNYGLLVKGMRRNRCANLVAVPKAVSNCHGTTTLFLDRVNAGGPSLAIANIPEGAGSETVATVTLDAFFAHTVGDMRVDVLKIDIQGAEGLAFAGADRILCRNDVIIMMEFWPFGLRNVGTDPLGLLQHLQAYGFDIKVIDELHQCVKPADLTEIIQDCLGHYEGRGFVDLLLEKPQSSDATHESVAYEP